MLRVSWITLVLSGLVVAAAGVTGGSGRAASSPGGLGPARAVKWFTAWLDESEVRATSDARWASIARHNQLVILNSWDFRLIPVLKRANPRIQVWVYKDLSGVRSDDCTTGNGQCGTCPPGVTDSSSLSSGIGYCWLKRNHPDWLLRAASTGQPFQFRGYPGIWEADYGNRAYVLQWISNVAADVRAHGWDGVEMDNALTRADAYGLAAKYPSDAAVQAATYSALREAGPALRRAGAASVANVGYATMFQGLWRKWLGPVTGLEQEFYLSYSTQPDAVGVTAWQQYEAEISACAAQHKSCWFHSGQYTPRVTYQTRRYSMASYLLATAGQQFWAFGDMRRGTRGCLSLGAPVTPMGKAGNAWERYFANGVAVTNPTRSSATVHLHGTYLDFSGRPVTAVSLGPASGAVLCAVPKPGASVGADIPTIPTGS